MATNDSYYDYHAEDPHHEWRVLHKTVVHVERALENRALGRLALVCLDSVQQTCPDMVCKLSRRVFNRLDGKLACWIDSAVRSVYDYKQVEERLYDDCARLSSKLARLEGHVKELNDDSSLIQSLREQLQTCKDALEAATAENEVMNEELVIRRENAVKTDKAMSELVRDTVDLESKVAYANKRATEFKLLSEELQHRVSELNVQLETQEDNSLLNLPTKKKIDAVVQEEPHVDIRS